MAKQKFDLVKAMLSPVAKTSPKAQPKAQTPKAQPKATTKAPKAPEPVPAAPLTKAEKRAARTPEQNQVLTNAALKAWATRRAKAEAAAKEAAAKAAAEAAAKAPKAGKPKRKAS